MKEAAAGRERGFGRRDAAEMERSLRDLRVGFVGVGRMASAVAQAVLLAGEVPPVNIFASAPSNRNLDKFQNLDCKTTHCNLEVVENSTFVFLATKPHILPAVLREIAPAVHSHHVVISMAAGVTLQTLEEMLPAGTKVLRIMPNLPCTVQSGAIVLARGSFAGEQEAALLKKLLSPCGLCEEGPESYIDIHTGLSGSGVAYAYMFAEALAEGAVKMGMQGTTANKIAAQTLLPSWGPIMDLHTSPGGHIPFPKTQLLDRFCSFLTHFPYSMVWYCSKDSAHDSSSGNWFKVDSAFRPSKGAAKMILETGEHPAVLRSAVCTPGGTTIHALHELEKGCLRATVMNAVEAATCRAHELGKR